jgi:fatty-acyl-CoA synthase
LIKNKKIAECYVFGVPDENVGEEVCAWVKLVAGGGEMSVDELRAFCAAEKLEPFKIPKYVKFVSAFPTVSGKVQKYKMVDAMISEMHHAISQQRSY